MEEAERVISALEAKVEVEYGRALPPIEEPKSELHLAGTYREIFSPTYRGRTILLMVFHIAETVGIYGFGNWMPTLLIAKGIHVTQSLQYMFVIALAYPAWPIIASLFASRIELKWQMCIGATGIAAFGLLMITQQMALPIITIGILLACSSCWLSFSFHAYQSELYPTRMRARAVGFVYSWSRLSTVFTSYAIAAVLGVFGVPGVFGFIALAMAVVVVTIGVFGPRTNQLALEEISR
jgi:putative MFS transporter